MPVMLTDENPTLTLVDNTSGSEVVFTYRMPTTQERTAYANAAWRRKGTKLKNETPQARREYGVRLLLGIRDGDFMLPGPDGKPVPLSSDKASPHFRQDWKQLVMKYAGHLVEALAAFAFDNSAEAMMADGLPDDELPAEAEEEKAGES